MSETAQTVLLSVGSGIGFAVIAGVILLIVEYRTGWFAVRAKKELSYEIVSSTPLATLSEDAGDELKILYNNEEVRDVTSLVVRIKNTGKVPILSADYEQPIEIILDGLILRSRVVETYTNPLLPTIFSSEDKSPPDTYPGRLYISPILINQGESITVSLLLTDYKDDLTINTRVAGITEVKRAVSASVDVLLLYRKGATAVHLVASLMLSGIVINFAEELAELASAIPLFMVISLAVLFGLFGMLGVLLEIR